MGKTPSCFAMIALTFLGGCFGPSGDPLKGADIQDTVLGQSFRFSTKLRGARFEGTATFNRDGTVNVSDNTGNKAEGEWFVTEDQICASLSDVRNGQEFCSDITKDQAGIYHASYGVEFKLVQPGEE